MSTSSSSSSSSSSSEAPQAPKTFGPELPPKEEWEPNEPLFINKLPEDLSTVPGLEALQAINAEMTPEERAENFKDQGNEFFALGKHKYHEAIKCFTNAIREGISDPKKQSVYYCNRAFVNLKLGLSSSSSSSSSLMLFQRRNVHKDKDTDTMRKKTTDR